MTFKSETKNKNLYQVLGLNSNATQDEIKRAYRIYASKFHPDKHNGDPFFDKTFRDIKEAYEILNDLDKKAAYDLGWRTSEEGHEGDKTSSATKRQGTSAPIYVDPIIERRNRNILIGFGTLIVTILIFNVGGDRGWHVPFGMLFVFWTIRQVFVIGTSYLKD